MHALLFGCCLPGGPYDAQRAQRLAQAGFDYAEIAAAPLAAMTPEEFAALRREQEAGGLPIRAANCFLPGELSLFDSGRQEALRLHVRCVLERAAETPYSAASEAASEVSPEASSDTASDAAPDAVSEEPSLTGVPLTRFSKSSFASR